MLVCKPALNYDRHLEAHFDADDGRTYNISAIYGQVHEEYNLYNAFWCYFLENIILPVSTLGILYDIILFPNPFIFVALVNSFLEMV